MLRVAMSLGLCTVLAGCLPFLPPVMSAASLGVSGLSVLTTGKSASDHVISATNEQDCALHRLLFLEPVCREYGDDAPQLAFTYPTSYPGDYAEGHLDRTTLVAGTDAWAAAPGSGEPGRVARAPARIAPELNLPGNATETNSSIASVTDTGPVDGAPLPVGQVLVAAAAPVVEPVAITRNATAVGTPPVMPRLVPDRLRRAGQPLQVDGASSPVVPQPSPFRRARADRGAGPGTAGVPLPALASRQVAFTERYRVSGPPPSLSAERVALPRVFSRS